MMAGLANDKNAKWNCKLAPKGLRLKIEEVVNKSELGELVIARVYLSGGKGSVVGYTMNIGLSPR